MADVFVSYSRRDAAFVRRLVDALAERGKEAWVDVEEIRDAEVFPARLRSAIEESDGFLFVISPDSVASEYCEQEVEHALELNKRIVPLLLRPAVDDEVPEGVRVRSWIPFGAEAEFEPGVARVVEALDADLAWARAHTRWLVKALEWDAEEREKSLLLRGSELVAAEAWLASEAGKEPEPTGLQREYVAASRLAASRRQRRLLGAAAAVSAISLGLLAFALISRSSAIAAGKTSKSQALAAESQTQQAIDPERSILLAVAAMRERATPEATFALRAALDASPIRYRLPDAPPQICGQQGAPAPGIAFAPRGRRLAEGLCGGRIVIADARDGHVLRRLTPGTDSSGGPIAYSPDGHELAVCCRNGSVVLLDAATDAVRGVGPEPLGGTYSVAFDPKAPLLALGGLGGQVLLWDYRSRRTRMLFGVQQNGGSYEPVSLAFAPDGRRIAVGSVDSNAYSPGLLLLDVRSGRVVARTPVGTAVLSVAFSRDGTNVAAAQLLASGTGLGRIALFDATTLALRRTLVEEPGVEASAVAFAPDGTAVAYGFVDGTAGLVSTQTGQRLLAYPGQTADVDQVAFSPEGTLVATASADGTARIWTTVSGGLLAVDAGGTIDALHAFRNRFEAVVHRRGRLEVETWNRLGRAAAAPLVISPSGGTVVGFLSPDGRLAGVAVTYTEEPVVLWSVGRRRIAAKVPTDLVGGSVPDLSRDGSLVAMTDVHAGLLGLTLVHVRSEKRRFLGRTPCNLIAQPFDRAGTLVAAGDFCGRVEIWRVATGRRVAGPFAIGGEASSLAFDPSGTRIAAASWNGVVTIADAATGRIVGQLTGDTSGVTSVAYSPDGRFIATASLDRTARIWDARTLRPLRVLTQPAPVYGVRFTPDGTKILTWDDANVIRLEDACSDCEDPRALLALARTRVTRGLTAQETRTFGVG